LEEIESISVQSGSGPNITTKDYRQFGSAAWQAIYNAHGDLHSLGIEVISDRPVAHFDLAWQLSK
jgi:hypothetical protein